jgi:hypothetical protein
VVRVVAGDQSTGQGLELRVYGGGNDHERGHELLEDVAAMRIETLIKSPRDLGCSARLPNLDDLQTKPVPATAESWMLNVSVRAASSRVQPLSGSRTPPSTRRVAGPRPCGSAILGSWP